MTAKSLSEIGNKSARKLLHLLSRYAYDGSVTKPISQILRGMKQRVEYEHRQIQNIGDELAKLADAYNRYLELAESMSDKVDFLNRLETIIGKTKDVQDLKLREILKVYLTFVPEAQVADILGFFEWAGYKSTRQAIESTIKTHKDIFIVRKDGWDRFISLARKE
jgi:predicted transcriptional regulator